MKLILNILIYLLLSNLTLAQSVNKDSLNAYRFYDEFQYDSAIYYFKAYNKSLLFKKSNNIDIGIVKLQLGKAYQLTERFDSAFSSFHEALLIFEKEKSWNNVYNTLIQISEYYRRIRDFDLALKYIKKAENIDKVYKVDKKYLPRFYNRYAAILSEKNSLKKSIQIPEVLTYSLKAISLSDSLTDRALIAGSYNEIGLWYENTDAEMSIQYYLKAYYIFEKQNDLRGKVDIHYSLCRVYSKMNRYQDVIENAKKGLEIAGNHSWNDVKRHLLHYLVLAYRKTENYEKTLDLIIEFYDTKAKYQEEISSKQLSELRVKYQAEEKEKELLKEKQIRASTELRLQHANFIRDLFLLTGIILILLISILIWLLKKSMSLRRRLDVKMNDYKSLAAQKEMLVKEVHHRVKNNLAVVGSLLELESDRAKNEEHRLSLLESSKRIESIAILHKSMYLSDNYENVNLKGYVLDIISLIKDNIYSDRKFEVKFSCSDIDIMFDKAVPVGIILNELLSNSIKHALPLNNSLTIIIAIKRIDNSICLEYSDNGQGFDSRLNNQNGMGQFLIKSLIKQLGGSIEINSQNCMNYKFEFEIN